jgi:hypothetical protein
MQDLPMRHEASGHFSSGSDELHKLWSDCAAFCAEIIAQGLVSLFFGHVDQLCVPSGCCDQLSKSPRLFVVE